MPSIEIAITAEDVEALVRESLVKHSIGKTISEAVSRALSGFNNPIDKAVQGYVAEVADKLIRETYADQIRAAVAKTIEDRVTDELMTKIVEATVNRMAKAAEDYP